MLDFLKNKKGFMWDSGSFILGMIVGTILCFALFIGLSFAGIDLAGLIASFF